MSIHHLKIQRQPFEDLVSGRKTGEVRSCADREFCEGDQVELFLIDETGNPANKSIVRTITHVQRGFGLPDDTCVLSYAAPVVERQDPVAWRGINCYDEVVTDWIDGVPGPMTDLCGKPASYYRIEYAYLSPPSLEVELPTVCASDSPHELKRDIIEILEASGIRVKK